MNAKDRAGRVIDLMPDDSTHEEIIRALHAAATFERGKREIRRGQGIVHEPE